MFPEQLSFRFSIITFAILFACSSTANGGVFDDLDKDVNNCFHAIGDAARSSACVASQRSDYNKCYDTMMDAFFKLKKNDLLKHCCNFFAYFDCVDNISRRHCGEEAVIANRMVLNPILIHLERCDTFLIHFYCQHTVIQIGWYIFVIMAMFSLFYLFYGLYQRLCG